MKTTLPKSIKTKDEAIAFLTELHNNDESFHPEDDAFDVSWITVNPSIEERQKLNDLMGEIYQINGFDPCEILLDLLKKNNQL